MSAKGWAIILCNLITLIIFAIGMYCIDVSAHYMVITIIALIIYAVQTTIIVYNCEGNLEVKHPIPKSCYGSDY